MAARKKKVVKKKKVALKAKKAVSPKKTKTKPRAKAKAKPAPKAKKPAPKRKPPMHASVNHPELSDASEGEEERDEVFEVFKSFDRDGSGSIDRGELSRLLEALGQEIPEVELAIALDVIDVNRSGRISWDEFKAWWSAA